VRDVSGEGETVSLHAHEGEVSRLGFSPDGALLVTASTAGGLRVLEVDTGEERAHGTHPGPVVALAFHPEQPMLFTGGGGTVCFWDVRPGREASSQPLNEVPGEVTGLAMRPDGRGLAVSSQSGSSATIHLVPLGKEKPRRLWTFPELRVQSMAFSPDGTRLAVGLADGRVHLWKVDSASVLQSLYCGKKPVHFLEFSPDGEGLVTASGDLLRLWRLEGEKTLFWAEEGFSTCASAVFPPEGGLLLANAIGARVRLRVFSADGDD
jgi:WD40 repeat protein